MDEKLLKEKADELIVKDKRSKTILTPQMGKVTFIRRRYFDTKTKPYKYLLDEKLNIDKNKLVNKEYRKNGFMKFTKLQSYKRIQYEAFKMNQKSSSFIRC